MGVSNHGTMRWVPVIDSVVNFNVSKVDASLNAMT